VRNSIAQRIALGRRFDSFPSPERATQIISPFQGLEKRLDFIPAHRAWLSNDALSELNPSGK
jgi:hypothetical protein